MSSQPRRTPSPQQLNPYTRDEFTDGRVPLKKSDPAGRAILDAWADRSAAR